MMKKCISGLLSIMLLLSVFSMSAYAADTCTAHTLTNTAVIKNVSGIEYVPHLGQFIMYGQQGIMASVDGLNWEHKVSYGQSLAFSGFVYGGNDMDGYKALGTYGAGFNKNRIAYANEYFTGGVQIAYNQAPVGDGTYRPLAVSGQIVYDDYTGYFYAGAHELQVTEQGEEDSVSYTANVFRTGIYRTKGNMQTLNDIYVCSQDKVSEVDACGEYKAIVWEKLDTTYDGVDWNVYTGYESSSDPQWTKRVYGVAACDGKGHLAFTQGEEVSSNTQECYNTVLTEKMGGTGYAQNTVVLADLTGETPRYSGVYNVSGRRYIGELQFDLDGNLLVGAQWGGLNRRTIYVPDFAGLFTSENSASKAPYNLAAYDGYTRSIPSNTGVATNAEVLKNGQYVTKADNVLLHYVPITVNAQNYLLAIPNTGVKIGGGVINDTNKAYAYNDILVMQPSNRAAGFAPFLGNDTLLKEIYNNYYSDETNPGVRAVAGAAYSPDSEKLVILSMDNSTKENTVHVFDLSKLEQEAVAIDLTKKAFLSVNESGVVDDASRFTYPVDRSSLRTGTATQFVRHQHDGIALARTEYNVVQGGTLSFSYVADRLDETQAGSGILKTWRGGACGNINQEIPIEILSADSDLVNVMDIDTYQYDGAHNPLAIYENAVPGTYHMTIKVSIPDTATRYSVTDVIIHVKKPVSIYLNDADVSEQGFAVPVTGLVSGENTLELEYNRIADAKQNVLIALALYKNDELVEVQTIIESVSAGYVYPGASFTFNIPPEETLGSYTAKVYYWSADGLTPL